MKNRHVLPGVLGFTILLWSWTVQLWPVGLLLAALLEAPRWIPWRFQISDKQLAKIFKLFLLIAIAIFVSLLAIQRGEALNIFVQWLPVLLLPAILVQLYHQNEQFPMQLFVDSVISRASYSRSPFPNNLDLQLPYALILLIAISIPVPAGVLVFLFFCLIAMFSFSHIRPKSFRYLQWVSLISLSFLLAFFIKGGLVDLQRVAQELTMKWLTEDWSQRNMFNNQTAMGELGELKLSNRIVMRIAASEQQPLLLAQASYSHFISNSWHMEHSAFKDIEKKPHTNTWVLSKTIPGNSENLSVFSTLKKGRGVLALPDASYEIENNRTGILSINRNGSVRIRETSTLLDYTVYYDSTGGSLNYSEPGKSDMNIPSVYREVVDETAKKAGLIGVSAHEATENLEAYFENNFRYSLFQKKSKYWHKPLEYFLRDSYQGHCEYFATAGALILRAAGIPTRYVTGFSMSEFDASTQRYLIRQRHAHAWIQAYVDGEWVVLDYTPSTWAELEAADDPWWLGVSDFISLKIDDFQYWWQDDNDSFWTIVQLSVGVFLLAYLARRARFGGSKLSWLRKRRGNRRTESNLHSPFQRIIDHFEKTVDQRGLEETIYHWLERIEKRVSLHDAALFSLLQRHYELIYRDSHWSEQELQKFSKDVEAWLLKRERD